MLYRRRLRPRRRRLVKRRPRFYRKRKLMGKAQYAKVSETTPLIGMFNGVGPGVSTFNTTAINTPNACYSLPQMNLAMFPRSSGIAGGFQFFRIKYFEVKILPAVDTFAIGATGGVPYLYHMVDKGGSIPDQVINQGLKSMGAKAIRLDDKVITIRWKPGVNLDTEYISSGSSAPSNRYAISPWLNTNASPTNTGWTASLVSHRGLLWFAENVGASTTYYGSITAHFEFKRPNVPSGSS